MADKARVYISFDYDNDDDLKILLAGQAENDDSPFSIVDASIPKAVTGDWKASARTRIKGADVVTVICGKKTDTAAGVAAEVTIAQEEGVSYFLLAGRADGGNKKPTSAKSADKMYDWTWPNLKKLIHGER
jgi:hypothetical protein